MIQKAPSKGRVILIRPGATNFDDQGRIKGSLGMPLSDRGHEQALELARDLSGVELKTIYSAPCESAQQTAQLLAQGRDVRVKVVDAFRNVNHGLWHGKLIEEVRRNHPRLYRQGLDAPDEICPPEGESIRDAKARVIKSVRKVLRKSGDEVIAIVIPDPLASVVESLLSDSQITDLWKAETDAGRWQLIEPSTSVKPR